MEWRGRRQTAGRQHVPAGSLLDPHRGRRHDLRRQCCGGRVDLHLQAPGAAMTGALILIVEDNDKNRKLVRDVLTFKGL